jgi:hypothetical protein
MISDIRSRKKFHEIIWEIPTLSMENNPILGTLDLFVPHYLDVVVQEARVVGKTEFQI